MSSEMESPPEQPAPKGISSKIHTILLGLIALCAVTVFAIAIAIVVKVYQKPAPPPTAAPVTTAFPTFPTTTKGKATTARATTTVAPTTPATTTEGIFKYTNAPISDQDPRAPEFRQAATMLRVLGNYSFDPCNNFYEFTCQAIKASNPMSFTKAYLMNVLKMMNKLTDATYRNSGVSKPVQQLFDYFDTCKSTLLNWDQLVRDGHYVKEKLAQFQAATGLMFPILDQSQPDPQMPDRTQLARAMGYLDGVLRTATFITPYVDTNWEDPHSTQGYMLMVDQSTLVFPNSFYLKAWDELKAGYLSTIVEEMNFLQKGLDGAQLTLDAENMMQLELDIAKRVSTDDTTRRNYKRSYNRYSVAQATQEFPFLDWNEYFKQFATFAPVDVQTKMVQDDFEFIIMEPAALKRMATLLASGEVSARTIVNYLNFRVVDTFSNFLPRLTAKHQKKQNEFDVRVRTRQPRNIIKPSTDLLGLALEDVQCAASTINAIQYANARVFIDEMYPTQNDRVAMRQKFADFMESVLIAFRGMIDQLSWMSTSSKRGAYKKIDDLTKNIAYPDFITNNEQLSHYYRALEITAGDSFTTMQEKLYKFNVNTELAKLTAGAAQRDDFSGPPGTVNAWYQPEMNSITFPAGILQQPFYDPNWPSSINYGSMGVIVGHELTHGFDDQGIQWDGTGVLYKWMDNSSFVSFKEMAQCVINEYGSFCPLPPTYSPSCLDGSNTQSENIADNGGIHAAYRAFKNHQNLNGPDPSMADPIMRQFTPDQLFFMGFAQVWCEMPPNDNAIMDQILTDPHSPSLYRVLGTMQNFPAFRTAFNCPLNMEYTPRDHCDVWVTPVQGSYGIPDDEVERNPVNILPAPEVSPSEDQKYAAYGESVQMFKASMNMSASPCNNFYDYVCGNYGELLSFRKERLKNYNAMSYQMELPKYQSPQTPTALKKIIQFYETCKSVRADFPQYISDGAAVLNALNAFKEKTGLKFSMVESQTSQSAQPLSPVVLAKAVGYLSSQGIDTLLSTLVDTNWEHPEHYSFYSDQNVLYYSKTYYSPGAWATTRPSYKQNTMDLFNHFAALQKVSLDQQLLSTDVDSLLDLEKILAQQYSTDDTSRRHYKRSYNPSTVAEATSKFPFIDFATYFQSLSSTYPQLESYFTAPGRTFLVMEPAMISKLSTNFNSAFNSNTVANYFFYRILAANSEYLPKPAGYQAIRIVTDEHPLLGRPRRGATFAKTIQASHAEPTVKCALETLNQMQYANARIFVDYKYPNKEAVASIRTQVGSLIENILMSMRGMLNRLDWMDSQSKKGAYNKVTDLVENIAFPDFILDDAKLDLYYADLQYTSTDSYFDLLKKTDKFNFELTYKLLVTNAVVDRKDFGGPPGTVNAWYYPEYNSITFPAGILVQPFFDEKWPASLNYGGLGVLAGHELTHGFDDEGVQWSGNGTLIDWMTQHSQQGFQNMADCVVKEYDGFCPLKGTGKVPECINGEQTQGENIADNGGIHSAWLAYQNHVSQYGPDPQLPDPVMNIFTQDQLFFMAFAQVWCEEPRTVDQIYTQIMTDPHSNAKYRVFGTIQNFPAFRTAFNCPLGSAYGPKEHCSVWVPEVSAQGPPTVPTPTPVPTTTPAPTTTPVPTTTPSPVPTVAHYTPATIRKDDPRAKPFSQAADLFRSMINPTADPCKDFYSYTCGRFNGSTTSMSFLEADSKNTVSMVLQLNSQPYRNSKLPKPMHQLFAYYDQCKYALSHWEEATNNYTFADQKLADFHTVSNLSNPLLAQALSDPAMPDSIQLAKAMGYMDGVLHTGTFISSYIESNWKDPHSTQGYMLFVDQATLFYPLRVYRKGWQFLKYNRRAMEIINAAAKVPLNQTILEKDVEDMLTMEFEIATNLTASDASMRQYDHMFHRYSLVKAQREFPFIDWTEYFKQFSTFADDTAKAKIRAKDFEFIMTEPDLLRKLGEYLSKGTFSARTVVNYLNFRVMATYHSYRKPSASKREESEIDAVSPDAFDVRARRRQDTIIRPLPRRRHPSNEITPNDVRCVGMSNSNLQYANARAFIDKIYPTESGRVTIRNQFADFVEKILIGFRSMIDQLSWMSDSSKEGAYKKIQDLTKNVAYPDFITNDAQLSKYYEALDITGVESFPTITENIFKFNMHTAFAKLNVGGTDRADFLSAPASVNAWYMPSLNSITFPAAILQQPFYDPQWPAAVNFGSMGVVVGHELTHGFDDQGVQWDGTGVLNRWMDNSSYTSFQGMAKCVVDEYSNFCPISIMESILYGFPRCLDGSNTQGENIADNGGIHAAYRAFKNYQSLNGPDPLLDDPIMRQFTPDQLFFMSFAQVWCQTPATTVDNVISILLDPHSPSLYRVLGTVQNFPAFKTAFNCPANSKYAPSKHCDVWVTSVNGTYGEPVPPKEENELNILPAPEVSSAEETKREAYSQAVDLFKLSMNLSANPCDNFFEYVCGSYEGRLSFTKGRRANYRAMSDQMELPLYRNPQTPPALKKTIQFYDACKKARVNFPAAIADGSVVLSAINEFKKQSNLDFSMVDKQNSQIPQTLSPKVLGKAVGYLSTQGIYTLISGFVDTNWTNPDNYAFFLDQNELYYSKTYYSPVAWPTTYKKYKANTMALFNHYAALVNVKLDQTRLDKDVDALLDFEVLLARNFSTSKAERRQFMRSYNPYTSNKLAASFNFIDFPSYFKGLSTTFPELEGNLTAPGRISIVMEPEMIDALSKQFIQSHVDTNMVANYLFYRVLAHNRQYLPTPKGYQALKVITEETPLGRPQRRGPMRKADDVAYTTERVQCAYETLDMMQYANARIFVDYSYPDKAAVQRIRGQVGGIIENILLSFRDMINRLEWMDSTTKIGAYGKITDLVQNIAFPDWILNDAQLNDYYQALNFVNGDSYFDIIKKIDDFNFQLDYKHLVQNDRVDRHDFGGPPGTVNAWYYDTYNSITFPAGILHQPFFDENWPASMNYGGLGLVAGHELTHGFDDKGVQWNGAGALQGWMSNHSKDGFDAMAQCVVDEYSGFCPLSNTQLEPKCVSGKLTQGENIADNGGAHAAWRAYHDYITQYGPDGQLPDPMYGGFSQDQLFFMSFAQVWCEPTRSNDALYRQLMTDPHSPSEYRVWGTIQNFPAFREAFNCPLNSPYGPQKHCNVWVPGQNN